MIFDVMHVKLWKFDVVYHILASSSAAKPLETHHEMQ